MKREDESYFLLRAIARKRGDRRKVACLQRISKELAEDDPAVLRDMLKNTIAPRVIESMIRTAGGPIEPTAFSLAEQKDVTRKLTAEDFEDSPWLSEDGLKIGDEIEETITLSILDLPIAILTNANESRSVDKTE